jgi:3'(2'), 5'-bisphosphate nucleotidase
VTALDRSDLIDILAPVMRAAGRLIEAVREAGFETRGKSDLSPVTEADERAELLITAALRAADPDTPIVGEEAHAAGHRPPPCGRFWLIDPLDGTRDFIAGRPAYSVNIGLIEDGCPVLGLVLSPRDGVLWAGAEGHGAFRQDTGAGRVPIATRPCAVPPVVVVSHSHLDDATRDYLSRLGLVALEPAGSSLKFCRLAEGSADVYPRYGPTCEWDTAAGHAVLIASGGAMRSPGGADFGYGKPDYLNGAFLAVGDAATFATLPAL